MDALAKLGAFFRTRRPGPRGTGLIIENIEWMLWDDAKSPGLIKRDKFYSLTRMALSEKEVSQLTIADARAHMITGGKVDRIAVAEVATYHAKVSKYLERMREVRPETLRYWLDSTWDEEAGAPEEGILLLKAFLNVLRHWDYPFEWRDAHDAQGALSMIVVKKIVALQRDHRWRAIQSPFRYVVAPHNYIEYCVHRDEVVRIAGRPHDFTIDMRDAAWQFDYRSGDLLVTAKA